MIIKQQKILRLPIYHHILFQERSYALFHFLKRSGDIFFSLLVIILLFPLFLPLIGLLIKLDSKGNIFYRQARVGYKGKVFNCWKFRTMLDGQQVTGIGKFLRNTGLDELPQFINVLKNDMSMIGPRPYALNDYEKFSVYMKGFTSRNLVKPGITGLSQVFGHKGPIRDSTELEVRTTIDLIYINNRSIIQEWNVVVLTLHLIIKELMHFLKAR